MNFLIVILIFLTGEISNAEDQKCTPLGDAAVINNLSNLQGEYLDIAGMISKTISENPPEYKMDYNSVDYMKCLVTITITFDGVSTLKLTSTNATGFSEIVFSTPVTGNALFIDSSNGNTGTRLGLKYLYIDNDWQVLILCGVDPSHANFNMIVFLLKKENSQSSALSFQDVVDKIKSMGFEAEVFESFCPSQ